VALRPRLSPGVPLSRCGATVETGAAVVKADCPALEVGTLACSRVPAGPGLVSVSDRGSGAGERNGSLRGAAERSGPEPAQTAARSPPRRVPTRPSGSHPAPPRPKIAERRAPLSSSPRRKRAYHSNAGPPACRDARGGRRW
jgi:hypothetical protein